METLTLSDQQGLCIAELPPDYRVIGIDRSAPFVRKPTGQILRILLNGNLTAATSGAKDRLAGKGAEKSRHVASGVQASAPYTSVVG
jgi:hypothetical protein